MKRDIILREQLRECLPTWTDEQRQDFFEGYRRLYQAIAKALGLPIHDRSDFVQQCFSIVLDKESDFNNKLSVWPWVATIGWHEGRNWGRRQSRRQGRESELAVEPSSRDVTDPLSTLIGNEDLWTILNIIEMLRTDSRMNERTIVIGNEALRGADTREIADKWGCSTDAVLLASHRLKNAIRARLPKVVELHRTHDSQ